MKTQDLISVASIAVVGTIIGYFGLNAILGDPLDKSVSFDYIEFNLDEFYLPDENLFNPAAINPTVDVYVGTCVDLNQNGVLESWEKVECGEETPTRQNEVSTSEENATAGEGETSSENSTTENSANNSESSTEGSGGDESSSSEVNGGSTN